MQKIKQKDVLFYWNLGLDIIILDEFNNQIFNSSKNKSNIDEFLSKDYKNLHFYLIEENKNRFLKYLIGNLFVFLFCSFIFGLVFLSILIISLANGEMDTFLKTLPILLMTGIGSFIFFLISKKYKQKLQEVLKRENSFYK